MKVLRNKSGFTMIELMIVAIIVAILAVVLIPLMSGNKLRAYATEAESALGTVRTAMRVYWAEHETFDVGSGAVEGRVPSVTAGDLDGTYFSDGAYSIVSDAASYTVTCDWSETTVAGGAPQAGTILALTNIATLETSINEDGNITRTGY